MPRPVSSGTLLEAAYDPFTGHFLFLTKQGSTVTLTDVPLCTLSSCTGRYYRDASHATESLVNFQTTLTGAAGAEGLTVGEDGDLYVTDSAAQAVVVFARRRDGSQNVVIPDCATSPQGNCTTYASAPTGARGFSTPTADVLDAIFTVPGEEMVGLFNQYTGAPSYTGRDELANTTYDSSEYFSSYQPDLGINPPLYGRSALPGLLFDLGTVGASYTKYAQSAETASDGGSFIICPANPSEPCQLFARTCETDADCSAVVPGTRCQVDADVPYCASVGEARDDPPLPATTATRTAPSPIAATQRRTRRRASSATTATPTPPTAAPTIVSS